MGMEAILVMWPGRFEQTLVPPSYGVSIWYLSSIGPVVLEENMFENDNWRTDGRTMDARVIGILLAHPWVLCSGELKHQEKFKLSFEYFWKYYGKWPAHSVIYYSKEISPT